MKSAYAASAVPDDAGRPPQGGRGLKFAVADTQRHYPLASPSARRAWVEIRHRRTMKREEKLSPSARRAWVEITPSSARSRIAASPSARRAWVEMELGKRGRSYAEASPSARRAWVEISLRSRRALQRFRRPPQGGRGLKSENRCAPATANGRPPQGGRGLKSAVLQRDYEDEVSPSARRAWVEIPSLTLHPLAYRRPPQGGRGLKCWSLRRLNTAQRVALRKEGVG